MDKDTGSGESTAGKMSDMLLRRKNGLNAPHSKRGFFFQYFRSDPYSFIVRSEITTKKRA